MLRFLDDFLNQITMYRLLLYVLIFYSLVAVILSFFKLLPFSPINLVISLSFLTAICWVANNIFAKLFNAPTNLESVYITALILGFIMTPASNSGDFLLLGLIGVLSQASKYILALNKKHLFNPAAFAAVFSSLVLGYSASWWVGNSYMLIPVLVGGLLVVRKVRGFSRVSAALAVYAILTGPRLTQTILDSPIFFFSFIMLTEPLTSPPKKILQIYYGTIVGLVTSFQTPEVALLVGNIFSYLVSPKEKLLLKLKEKNQIARDTYEFVLDLKKKFNYQAGQYMEWTLPHKNPDSRGYRRFFTLASSPTEEDLRIGTKFYSHGSSWKRSLMAMSAGGQVVASQLAGEFTLPKDSTEKLAFVAGGIGITPFRSMVKYLLDTGQKRDIILFYSNNIADEIAYRDLFDKSRRLGVKTIYVNTETSGYINEELIKREAPDFKDRVFYLSGPHAMVDAFEKILKNMGVPSTQIKVDFFPGYA